MTRWRQLPSPHAPCWAIIDHAGRGCGGLLDPWPRKWGRCEGGRGHTAWIQKFVLFHSDPGLLGKQIDFSCFLKKEIATCKLVQNSKRSSPLDSATKYASWLRAVLSQLWNMIKDLFLASVGPLFMSFTAICLLLFSLAFCLGLWDNCPSFLFSTLSCRRKLLEPAQARLSSQHVIRLSTSFPC